MDGITALPITEEIHDGYQWESYPRWKDVDGSGWATATTSSSGDHRASACRRWNLVALHSDA
ncbi:hypothetical protein [Streptomyces sp. NPDC056544]|uniref:hypothetical protein n=1 Tax=unclassified Streptomyces TaxID=2593676 RepID=UPI00368440D1